MPTKLPTNKEPKTAYTVSLDPEWDARLRLLVENLNKYWRKPGEPPFDRSKIMRPAIYRDIERLENELQKRKVRHAKR